MANKPEIISVLKLLEEINALKLATDTQIEETNKQLENCNETAENLRKI